jgi:hypothetical protein
MPAWGTNDRRQHRAPTTFSFCARFAPPPPTHPPPPAHPPAPSLTPPTPSSYYGVGPTYKLNFDHWEKDEFAIHAKRWTLPACYVISLDPKDLDIKERNRRSQNFMGKLKVKKKGREFVQQDMGVNPNMLVEDHLQLAEQAELERGSMSDWTEEEKRHEELLDSLYEPRQELAAIIRKQDSEGNMMLSVGVSRSERSPSRILTHRESGARERRVLRAGGRPSEARERGGSGGLPPTRSEPRELWGARAKGLRAGGRPSEARERGGSGSPPDKERPARALGRAFEGFYVRGSPPDSPSCSPLLPHAFFAFAFPRSPGSAAEAHASWALSLLAQQPDSAIKGPFFVALGPLHPRLTLVRRSRL